MTTGVRVDRGVAQGVHGTKHATIAFVSESASRLIGLMKLGNTREFKHGAVRFPAVKVLTPRRTGRKWFSSWLLIRSVPLQLQNGKNNVSKLLITVHVCIQENFTLQKFS